MNQNIIDYLNIYINDPDPRFAVALSGEWGCGKTFFINNWRKKIVEASKKPEENDDVIVLSPIYVSLYGMKSVAEIITAINRELYPILYSKGAKIAKKILGIAGKMVLKTGFDFDNDKKEDVSLSMSLDSLGIFQSKDEAIKGDKFLIIDDCERSDIDIKELLGFINWMVEIAGCHVIIIGDFNKLTEDSKKLLNEFREKTIGKILKVKPDLEGAIDYFLKEDHPYNDWTEAHKDEIMRCV